MLATALPKPASAATAPIAPHGAAERRQVTMMFSDLVGYTALSVRIHTVAERVRKTLTWISM